MDSERLNQVQQVMEVIAGVIGAGMALYALWGTFAGRDGAVRVRMAVAQRAESYCQRQAEGWAHLADASRKVYDQGRSVTV